MKRNTLVTLGVVAGAAGLCCVGSLAFVLLGLGAAAAEEGTPGGSGLEGVWLQGSASMTSYRDLATGQFAPPSGSGLLLELRPDGTCQHSAMLQVSMAGCTSWLFTDTDDCSWAFDGQRLTLELLGGTVRSRMCGGEVKDKASQPRTLRYDVSRWQHEGQPRLGLKDGTAELVLRPQ